MELKPQTFLGWFRLSSFLDGKGHWVGPSVPGQPCSAELECPLLFFSGYCRFHEARARPAWMLGELA